MTSDTNAFGFNFLRKDSGPAPTKSSKGRDAVPDKDRQMATLAAGCFWGVEEEFRKEPGVLATAVGYTGGHKKKPTYKEVCNGDTGHAEAVQVEFDPKVVSYETLLDLFWNLHDPTTPNQQGPDFGEQYRSVIFFHNEAQKKLAESTRDKLQKSGELKKPIVTEIVPATEFFMAEDYHQQYVEKGGRAACHFRKKPTPKKAVEVKPVPKLNSLQEYVTQHGGTEPAFQNEYWNNHRAGIYVDVTSGKPLFSSIDKYDSGSGWPSFTKPLKTEAVKTKTDTSLGMARTEVMGAGTDSHLGHVFDDGPGKDGKRYCINSAALKFIPAEDLEKEGYGEFRSLFESAKK